MNCRLLHIISAFFIVLLCGLTVLGTLGGGAASAAASFIYVRTDGDDAICNGQYDAAATAAPACAFASIGKGVQMVDSGGTIVVAAGVYTESVSIDKDLTLQGDGVDYTVVDGLGTIKGLHVNRGNAADRKSVV